MCFIHLHEHFGNFVTRPEALADRHKEQGIQGMPDPLTLKLLFRDAGAFQKCFERQLGRHGKEMVLRLPQCVGRRRILVEDSSRIEVAAATAVMTLWALIANGEAP